MNGGFYLKSNALRLYIKRKEGGRGLVSVQATTQDETNEILEYMRRKAPNDELMSKCLRQQQNPSAEETEQEEPSWKDKHLHGMYHQQTEEVAHINKSYQWSGSGSPTGIFVQPPSWVLAAQPSLANKMVMANQPDIVVVNKQEKTAVVINVAIPSYCNIKKKEHKKLEIYCIKGRKRKNRRSSTQSQSAQQHPDNSQESSPTETLPSLTSSADSDPHTPEVSPEPQIRDLPSNSPCAEGCSPNSGSAPHSDLQGSSTGGEEEVKEAKNSKKHFHCPTCKVTVNSSAQLDTHCSGSKHKQMLDGQNSIRPHRRVRMRSSPRPKGRMKQRIRRKSRVIVGATNQAFQCDLCQVSVNSETQMKQHTNSRRHKERLAGKPVKAKFTPFNKLHPSAILATKLALQKQLSKALPAGLLTSPLNPSAFFAMASGPLALRLPPRPTAIFQGPFINPALFRPAPGPLRATHAPIIFSPY
ncbi:zinc finger protein 385D-like [Nematolebias whitei]|uniref:zinc finger protein 385D-like n=1 Tax=Nematolebias whitei TaxID=451745 RepID=UPI00189A1DFC|nr:zinc finger protein 385D-like [Nematolebias whitei]